MRRPPPLPAPADEPERVAEQPIPRAAAASHGEPGPVPDDSFPTEPIPDDAVSPDPLPDAGADAPSEPEEAPSAVGRPLGSADIWRAARARRKALRAEIRRFTQRSRRRRLVLWVSLGAVVLLIGGSLLAAYSPLFAVQTITVAGADRLDAAEVEHALSDQLGSPLALVDDSAVKSALVEFPLIESYSLEARPPHELLVRIVERTPIGVVESSAGFSLVDAAGVVLATTPEAPEHQPVLDISGGSDSAAFRGAGLVIRSLPADIRADLVRVEASSADDVTLRLAGGRSVVWGSAEDSQEKAQVLESAIAASPDAHEFDVSSTSVVVIR